MVASTVVSSRMLAAIANDHGARHVETLTGFKWLSRADVGLPGCTLVYAYEEAIGHCVDPAAVRDKDGISAAVLACDLVAALRNQGRTVLDALDDLARRHGVHTTTAVSRRVADADEAEAMMARLRATPPDRLAGFDVTVDRSAARARSAPHRCADLLRRRRRQLRCGWSCGRRAPNQKSSPTSRFAARQCGDLEATRAKARGGCRTSWSRGRRSASSADRTDGPRRRRDPARCRRCR